MASISLVRVTVLLFLFASLFEFVSGQFKPRRRKFRQVPTLSRSRSASNGPGPGPDRDDRPGPGRNRNNRRPPGRRLRRTVRPASPKDVNGTEIEPYDTVYWFDQLIDHNNPSKGTFKQRYWHTWEFYEPGGPIILSTPGEIDAEAFVNHITVPKLQGAMAAATGGATILLEHRFFGKSYPSVEPTLDDLKVHTIAQAIEDLAYFSQNVKLPMPGGSSEAIRPKNTPWILMGGSYAGALVSWTMKSKPGNFWAGYSSSGVVQPIGDFWQYFEPIRQHMPKNCSADVQRVVNYIDDLVAGGDERLITTIKEFFSLGDVDSTADFLLFLHAPLLEWQSLDVESVGVSNFFQFCDALEVRGSEIAGPDGYGLQNAMQAWAEYFASSGLLASYTEDSEEDLTPTPTEEIYDGATWDWLVCNELGWILRGPPKDLPAISLRSYTLDDKDKSCRQTFPGAFDNSTLASRVDSSVKGFFNWNTTVDRIITVNGERDPWLYATQSSPNTNTTKSPLRPVYLTDGFHCSDLTMRDKAKHPRIASAQESAIQTMKGWLDLFEAADRNLSRVGLSQESSSGPGTVSDSSPLVGTQSLVETTSTTPVPSPPSAGSDSSRPPVPKSGGATRTGSTFLASMPLVVFWTGLWSLKGLL